ncbi:hypothetical protein EV126DRAFT_490229, partial [Verticillium dahliae]
VCKALLATSAASGIFDAVQIGARHFVSGALGANNPVKWVQSETAAIWCAESRDLKSLVKFFVSIGTGNLGKVPIDDRIDNSEFINRWRQHHGAGRFIQFNVEQGLQGVGLAEHDKRGVIETATGQYMDEATLESCVRRYVRNLNQKQYVSAVDFG